MAPTTLIGQKTTTSPKGRNALQAGYPLLVSELLATIEGASFIARTSSDSPKNLLKTKTLIEKAFRYQMEGKGFSLVEILSACPTDWGLSPEHSLEFIQKQMLSVFKPGILKDKFAVPDKANSVTAGASD